jgi:hypothetical protein
MNNLGLSGLCKYTKSLHFLAEVHNAKKCKPFRFNSLHFFAFCPKAI